MDRVLRSNGKENQLSKAPLISRRSKRTLSVLPSTKLNPTKVLSRRSVMSINPSLDFDKKNKTINTGENELGSNGIENQIPGRINNDQTIIGRISEILHLTSQLSSFIDRRQNASIYISGSPGTGKTAVTLHVVRNFQNSNNCVTVFINCMQLGVSSEIYSRIGVSLESIKCYKDTNIPWDALSVENVLNKIPNKRNVILVLDEIDQLSNRGQDILYRIFDWPMKLTCHIIIIGIANALDLPERLLPRLKAKSYKPVHMVFRPYSQEELVQIVNVRLSQISGTKSVLDPMAIQLCARKIAASTGDVRKALDVCRRAFDLAQQQETLDKTKSENNFNSFQFNSNLATTIPTIRHVSQALRESQVSTPCANTHLSNTELPVHHKILLASCMVLRRQKQLREMSFNQLYETYVLICGKKQITNLGESELASVCELLDSRGLVQFVGPRFSCEAKLLGTPARMKRIKLRLDDLGVEQILKDDLLVSTVMNLKLN